MLRIIVFVAVIGSYLLGAPARAEDELFASMRLRGGYDSNPLFSTGGGRGTGDIGSAFIGTEVGLIAAGKQDDITWNATAEANGTRYIAPGIDPALVAKLGLRGIMGDDSLRVISTTSFVDINTYNTHSTDLVQSVKVETIQDKIKWFVTGEVGVSRLNQTNVILQDFLPIPLQFMRGAIIPGVSVITSKGEVGVSVNLSMRRYAEELDLFGFRRDNERIQPFMFGRYESGDIALFAAVSQLYGIWHDIDFTNVNTTLFDASLTWRPKPFTLELAAIRRAGETTFPISPITIDTLMTAKGSWQVNDKWLLTAAAGYTSSVYLDSPYKATTITYGLGAVRDIGNGYKLGFDVTRITGTLLNDEKAQGYIVASSLSKSFVPTATKPKGDLIAKPSL
ncbi:hypothetical protein RPMA_19620 [Tardiphaga alba]|uniref:DUF5723 domain-containing protein n=1 Tax=Tardiphaga alba TaxID=340268 RepID=A0ABX8AAR9_9BRAD|nr:outer membrane beta-barrel protein [Tardiphaga alba]QUS40797.1 hypothetical protein RPMA_19620 [Tardiphaga alba]